MHKDLNPDLSTSSSFSLFPTSVIPKQPVENVCLFLSSSAPIPNRCLSSYLPITSTTYFPDARTTWSSCSPSPRDQLSSGSTDSNVSSPGFPREKQKEDYKLLSETTSLLFNIVCSQTHRNPPHCISFPCHTCHWQTVWLVQCYQRS